MFAKTQNGSRFRGPRFILLDFSIAIGLVLEARFQSGELSLARCRDRVLLVDQALRDAAFTGLNLRTIDLNVLFADARSAPEVAHAKFNAVDEFEYGSVARVADFVLVSHHAER